MEDDVNKASYRLVRDLALGCAAGDQRAGGGDGGRMEGPRGGRERRQQPQRSALISLRPLPSYMVVGEDDLCCGGGGMRGSGGSGSKGGQRANQQGINCNGGGAYSSSNNGNNGGSGEEDGSSNYGLTMG